MEESGKVSIFMSCACLFSIDSYGYGSNPHILYIHYMQCISRTVVEHREGAYREVGMVFKESSSENQLFISRSVMI